jgi:hypothetical protein
MNYHKAFLLYAVLRLFLTDFVPLFAGPPTINMKPFMDFSMLMLVAINYFDKGRNTIVSTPDKFPLKKPFFIYSVSLLLSATLFPVIPIFKAISNTSQNILSTFIFVYLFWRELKNPQDIRFFIKGLVIVFSIAILYGFFERFNGFSNPLIDYELSLNLAERDNLTFRYSDTDRGGLGRVQSIFDNALMCSFSVGVVFAFFYYINLRYKKIWNSFALIKISFFIGLLFLLLFSNSRGGIVYLGISLLLILKFKNILRLALFLPFLVIFFYDLIEPYIVMLSAIFDVASSEAGGSSLALRVLQFSGVTEIVKNSPWFGCGPLTLEYWRDQRPDLVLLGLESIWFKLLLGQGIIGIATHIYLLYSLVKLGINKSKSYTMGITIAFIIVSTATIGYKLDFFMIFLLIIYRLELWSNSQRISI